MSLDQITVEGSGAPLGCLWGELDLPRLPAGYLRSVVIPSSREVWTEKWEWVEDRGMTAQTQILPTHFGQGGEEHGYVISPDSQLGKPRFDCQTQAAEGVQSTTASEWGLSLGWQLGGQCGRWSATSSHLSRDQSGSWVSSSLALPSHLFCSHHLPSQQPLPSISNADGGGLCHHVVTWQVPMSCP